MPEGQTARRIPRPSPRPRHNDMASSSSSASCLSPDVHPHPSVTSDVLPSPVHGNTGTTRPPSIPRRRGPQNPVRPLSSVSRPLNQPGIRKLNLVQTTSASHSVNKHSAYLPSRPKSSAPAPLPKSSGPVPLPKPPYKGRGMFNRARDFAVTGTFVDGNVTYYNASSNQFMEKFLKETIPGAEFDSSDRDPPPRCQPGTRLAILGRCIYFISHCNGVQKMRWVVGAAGVGKSAIMQSVAESPDLPVGLPASIFFSINGRHDGTKAIITLSYQLAAKSDTYRQVIEHEITRDPSLLRSSMAKQFKKLIVEPFIYNARLNSAGRVLVIIDGLDECRNPRTQIDLLRLISDLCLKYPSSPLVWLIASRPEPHITSFFSKRDVIPAYVKEEVPIDSDEARADVERFLREELTKIKEGSDLLDSRWPEEQDFWKVANAAGGLFAYAQTVINYVGDWRIGSPASQLSDVLRVIDKHGMTSLPREEHPMALLDALYERILSNVPDKIMINTRKLLLALALIGDSTEHCGDTDMNFVILCNWVGLTADEAYAAIHHLRSVLYVPRRDQAHREKLRAFHKSFIDYISDFTRSGFSSHFLDEARQLQAEYAFRILTEVPNGVLSYASPYKFPCGTLTNGPVTQNAITLTWLVEGSDGWSDRITRLGVYKLMIDETLKGMKDGHPNFQSEICVHLLATMWSTYGTTFPYDELLDAAFNEAQRPELKMNGILKQTSLRAVAISALSKIHCINLEFCRPAITMKSSSDPWYSSCQHQRWDKEKALGWETTFQPGNFTAQTASVGLECAFCYARFREQLKKWKVHCPDDIALVLFTSTDECCVQVRFVYPEDGMAEWTYSFWCRISQDVRKKYENAV